MYFWIAGVHAADPESSLQNASCDGSAVVATETFHMVAKCAMRTAAENGDTVDRSECFKISE